ncbi:Serpentine Receptor class V [Trichostrongylus colubriformis]|uniref:Serpentine Receptor class V n=1 Tax=Trichostrongylus colubriformis TaxID=6319 RepID=A0AAN8F6K2_TRICO
MTANRVSAILFPRKYDNLWCGCRLKTAIAMQTIPGYAFSLAALSSDVKLIKIGRGGLVPGFKNPNVTRIYFMSAIIFLTANSIFLIFSYCYLFYALRKKHDAPSKIDVRTTAQRDRGKVFAMRREFRLFIMASIIGAYYYLS